MADQLAQLVLQIDAGPEADDEERTLFTQGLREQLLELNVDRVDQVRDELAPAGAKGDAVTLATLAVTLAPVALTELMKTLQAWLSRHERASVTVESAGQRLVVTGIPSKEQQQLVEAFVKRHKA
jgi:hypothetical protein